MGKGKEPQDKKAKHPEEKVFWIVGLAMVALFGAPGVFIFFFHDIDGGGPSEWAEFGTYFSGIATPIIAFCSALLFYRSIIVQRDEFEKTRREMESAKRHQVNVEEARNKLTRQEQIERALVPARDLQTKLLTNIKGCDLELLEIGEGEEIEEKVDWYLSRSLNVVSMINEYLDCGGDIYIILTDIKHIMAEMRTFQRKFTGTRLSEKSLAVDYFQAMDELYRRRSMELDKYADRL